MPSARGFSVSAYISDEIIQGHVKTIHQTPATFPAAGSKAGRVVCDTKPAELPDTPGYSISKRASSSMPYKWMLLGGVLMAVAPTYFLFQGDRVEAAIVGVPLLLIAMALFFCIWVLRGG